MYELNGNRINAYQLQQAADQNNMDLETFMRTFNVVEIGDEPQQDGSQVAPMQEDETKVKPLDHISFAEFNHNYEQEGDAEKHIVKKLREKYKDLPFDFDESGMLIDQIKVRAHNGAIQKFGLSSFWNYGSTAGSDNVFNGYSQGRITIDKTIKLPPGTYYYVIRFSGENPGRRAYSGYLYLNE